MQRTLAGSSPTTPGVQPNPDPKAMFTRCLTTVVFPEHGGPSTITLGPRMTCSEPEAELSAVPSEEGFRRVRMRIRSRARCRAMRWAWEVEVEE